MLRKVMWFSLLISVFLVLLLPVCAADADGAMNFLVVGTDDAAENADVIIIARCDLRNSEINVFQVPRDTYYRFGKGQNKLNQYFAFARAENQDKREVLNSFSSVIAQQFGITIDGSISLSTEGFTDIVDSYGGITIDMPYNYDFTDRDNNVVLSLKKGENTLNANQALFFVRFRSGYSAGDIARLDAQKIFIKGFFRTVATSGIEPLIKLPIKNDSICVDMPIFDLAKIFLKYRGKLNTTSLGFLTMPGKAVKSEGVWYYVLNKGAVFEVLCTYFNQTDNTFDEKMLFTDVNKPKINSIYTEKKDSFRCEISEESLLN